MFSFYIPVLISYMIGAIPTGFIIARLKGITDIRQHGSGNIGATNVARKLGLKYFFIVMFLDAAKAYGTILVTQKIFYNEMQWYILAVVLLLGNCYSIFLRFSGGKGVATGVGILLAFAPKVVLFLFVIWVVVLWLSKRVGIASIVSVCFLPICAFLYFSLAFFICTFCLATIIVWKHRANIKRVFS